MDDGLLPPDEQPAARPPSPGKRPRPGQSGDPRKQGQPVGRTGQPAGTARRQPSRATRSVIDPLLAASRGESVATPSERPRAGRSARRSPDESRPTPRDESRPIPREPDRARDVTGSQPLLIVDDPSLELQSPSGAIARPVVVDEPDPLFAFDRDLDIDLVPEVVPEVVPERSFTPEPQPTPAPVQQVAAAPVVTDAPVVERVVEPEVEPVIELSPEPEPVVAEPVVADEPRDNWSHDELLDRGPTVLPVIVPSEPVVAPPPAVLPEPTQAVPVVPVLPTLPTLPTVPLPEAGVPGREIRAPRPVTTTPRRRPRVRRVTRVVRHVDTWSVFKVALVFNLFLYFVALTSGVLLWQVAQNTGTVDNVERFFESFGWQTFELHGGEIYHNAWVAGLFATVGFTGLAVLAATLFNLITDLVGGIRVSVLEEEVVASDDRGVGWRKALRLPDRSGDQSQPG